MFFLEMAGGWCCLAAVLGRDCRNFSLVVDATSKEVKGNTLWSSKEHSCNSCNELNQL